MASLSYDLIVLGDDFAGLVAATLCASRGMRVLLAETRKPMGSYQLGGETLPMAPLYLVGTESPGFRRVVEELHFQHLLKRRLEPLDPPCQLIAPDVRLELDPDRMLFSRSLERELGVDDNWLLAADEAQEGLADVLRSEACMPPTGFWERRELGKHIGRCHSESGAWMEQEHGDRSRVLADLALFAERGADMGSALMRARAFATARQGLSRVEGDWKAWRGIFLEKFKSHNGEVRRVIPQELVVGWSKVTGLACVDDQMSCEYLIAAQPIDTLLPLMGKKPPKRALELAELCRPVAFRYTLNLVVHMSGVPEGMGNLCWSQLDPSGPATGGNFASLSTRAASQSGRAIVCIEGLAAANNQGEPVLGGMREALLEHARSLMPFVDKHLDSVDSPHEPALGSETRDLSEPVPPRPVWDCPEDETLGIQGVGYGLGLKHLCLAGAQTLPELGIEGQLIAGWSAAKLATASMGKRKTTSKQSVLADAG